MAVGSCGIVIEGTGKLAAEPVLNRGAGTASVNRQICDGRASC